MNNLRKIREYVGMTQKELGSIVGVSDAAIGLWENGKRQPNNEMLLKLGEALHCSVSDILSETLETRMLDAAHPLVKKYNALDNHGKEVVDSILDMEYKRCVRPVKAPAKVIPLFPAAAGPGEPIEGNAFDEYETDNERADFAVRISGDSMEPHFHDGEIVLCKREEVQTGDIAVVMVNGLLLVKQFISGYAGHWYLRSLNRDLANLDYDFFPSGNDTVNLFGVVIHKRIPLVQQ